MINNIINKIAIPDKYDPNAAFSPLMIFLVGISMVLIVIAIIMSVHILRKKQRGTGFAFLLGISVYLLFYNIYFLPNIVLSVLCFIKPIKDILNDSGVINAILTSIVLASVAFFGRTAASILLRKKLVKTGDHFYIGLAIAIMIGFFSIINLFSVFITCAAINQMGLQEVANTFDNEEDLVNMFDSIFEMMDVGVADYMWRTLSTIAIMVAQILLTIPVLDFIQKKISNLRYFAFYGILFLIMLFQNLGGQGVIPAFVEAVNIIVLTIVVFLLVKKTYDDNYKDDEYFPDYTSKWKKKPEKQPDKPMPKFDNLSKL